MSAALVQNLCVAAWLSFWPLLCLRDFFRFCISVFSLSIVGKWKYCGVETSSPARLPPLASDHLKDLGRGPGLLSRQGEFARDASGWSRGVKNGHEADLSNLGKTCSLASWVDSGITASDDSGKGSLGCTSGTCAMLASAGRRVLHALRRVVLRGTFIWVAPQKICLERPSASMEAGLLSCWHGVCA